MYEKAESYIPGMFGSCSIGILSARCFGDGILNPSMEGNFIDNVAEYWTQWGSLSGFFYQGSNAHDGISSQGSDGATKAECRLGRMVFTKPLVLWNLEGFIVFQYGLIIPSGRKDHGR